MKFWAGELERDRLGQLDMISAMLLSEPGTPDTRFTLVLAPVQEFSWWIVLWLLAFHGILAAIITELMSRTYGKWWLWLLLSLSLPVIGPVAILLYYWITSSSIAEARKRSFWQRFLFDGPVSLWRAFEIEKQRSQEPLLLPYVKPGRQRSDGERDPEIDALIASGKYAQARGQAWKMIEIAREAGHQDQLARYMGYLEIIAEMESAETGVDFQR